MATTMVHVRVDEKVKAAAAKTLASMGISVSDAVRMLLVRVAAEKALPFEVRVPNAATVKAMQAADQRKGKRFKTRSWESERAQSDTRRKIPARCEAGSAARQGYVQAAAVNSAPDRRRPSIAALQRSSSERRLGTSSRLPYRTGLALALQDRRR